MDDAAIRGARNQPRYDYYAAIMSPPGGFDVSPQEFLKVAPQGRTAVMQYPLNIRGYDINRGAESLALRAQSFELVREAAHYLASCGAEAVGHNGSNWVHAEGKSPTEIADMIDEISESAGTRFVMAGHCIIEALRDLGAKRIVVANGYYRAEWRDGFNRYLQDAGFDILASGNMIDYGLYESFDDLEGIESKSLFDWPMIDNHNVLMAAHNAAPEADAVVQTGSGMRTLDCIGLTEQMIGKPIVTSDVALNWGLLRALGCGGPQKHYGSLLRSLGPAT